MTLEDRIEEEMIVTRSELLEEAFEEVQEDIQILEDGQIVVRTSEETTWRGDLLLHLLGSEYAALVGRVESPGLTYDPLYSNLDAGESTIRKQMSEMVERGFVRKDEEFETWRIIPEQLDEIISYIEGTGDDS